MYYTYLLVILIIKTCASFIQNSIKICPSLRCSSHLNLINHELLNDIVTSKELIQVFDLANVDISFIMKKAISKAFDGGTAVLSLMWLRTAINYQYRYGTSTTDALKTLYKEGGLARLYQGLPFAIVQGPLSRFGDTASNALIISFFDSIDPVGSVFPMYLRTGLGSASAALWRILLMPIDTVKTTLQVDGSDGLLSLKRRVDKEGLQLLFSGALAASAATFVGHFPWFLTFNYLSVHLPDAEEMSRLVNSQTHEMEVNMKLLEILRSAFIGLCASCVSDVSSNSLRVLKTYRQTSEDDSSYLEIAKTVVREEGLTGLFGRGLQTRLFANALQGMLFSVLFKFFQTKK